MKPLGEKIFQQSYRLKSAVSLTVSLVLILNTGCETTSNGGSSKNRTAPPNYHLPPEVGLLVIGAVVAGYLIYLPHAAVWEMAKGRSQDMLSLEDQRNIGEVRKAAEDGDAKSQYFLGWSCRNGEGAPKDYAEAVKWYQKAAEQGYVRAQGDLGEMYAWGLGMAANKIEAYKWLKLSGRESGGDGAKAYKRIAVQMTPEQIAEGERLVAAFGNRQGIGVRVVRHRKEIAVDKVEIVRRAAKVLASSGAVNPSSESYPDGWRKMLDSDTFIHVMFTQVHGQQRTEAEGKGMEKILVVEEIPVLFPEKEWPRVFTRSGNIINQFTKYDSATARHLISAPALSDIMFQDDPAVLEGVE